MERRAPFPGRIPRPAKRAAGRTLAPHTPAHIYAPGILDPEGRSYIRRKLGRKLGKFASSIERVSVRVEDVNGPRGGVDTRCQIKVVLSGLPSIVVREQHHALQPAIDLALTRVEQAVARAVQRRRMGPLTRRRRG
jgi:ribosome-associated translation inhibitor RaiA